MRCMPKAIPASAAPPVPAPSPPAKTSAPAAGGGKTPNSTSADSIPTAKKTKHMDSSHIALAPTPANNPIAPSTAAQLDHLESEAIYILREAAAEFSNPVLLFSGGKDSTVLLRLAEKAFRP